MQPLEFLELVWGVQTGYVFLPQKGLEWDEGKAKKWPEDKLEIENEILSNEKADQYYCPNLFSKPYRKKEYVKKLRWLYADLDRVNPRKIPKSLTPTVLIQSSPGNYQALWRLKRAVSPDVHERLNRGLTYALGADRAGWDLTQVLRVPQTRNFKYPGKVRVKVKDQTDTKVSVGQIEKYLDKVSQNVPESQVPIPDLLVPAESPEELKKKVWESLSQRGKLLLETKRIPDDTGKEGRSGRLWELECLLLESGLEPEEVFVVLHGSVWNKFIGRHDGDLQLWREIQKANLQTGSLKVPPSSGLQRAKPRVLDYSTILSSNISEPEWLIEDWWTMNSQGIIAGLPKSYKSLIALDMAFSVAAEVPFLGEHEVNPKGVGPVLIVQQENSLAFIKDRLFKVSTARGLQKGKAEIQDDNQVVFELPPALPLMFYQNFAFDMTLEKDRQDVEEIVIKEGIKMIVFDPLYLLIGGADENHAKDMRPILTWLLSLRNKYNCSVVVVHHWGKGHSSKNIKQAGQRLLGSITLYGWLEAAVYLEASLTPANQYEIIVEREFRERQSPPRTGYLLNMGDIGDTNYDWRISAAHELAGRILGQIQASGVEGAGQSFLKKQIGMGDKKARKELDALLEAGLIDEKRVGKEKKYFPRRNDEN